MNVYVGHFCSQRPRSLFSCIGPGGIGGWGIWAPPNFLGKIQEHTTGHRHRNRTEDDTNRLQNACMGQFLFKFPETNKMETFGMSLTLGVVWKKGIGKAGYSSQDSRWCITEGSQEIDPRGEVCWWVETMYCRRPLLAESQGERLRDFGWWSGLGKGQLEHTTKDVKIRDVKLAVATFGTCKYVHIRKCVIWERVSSTRGDKLVIKRRRPLVTNFCQVNLFSISQGQLQEFKKRGWGCLWGHFWLFL